MNIWGGWWEQGIHNRILWGSLLKSCHLKDSRMKWWDKIKMGVNAVICAGMN
jgi:hypothetical protein